jgi:hypothetical protein
VSGPLEKVAPRFLHIFQSFSPQTQHLDGCPCQVLAGLKGQMRLSVQLCTIDHISVLPPCERTYTCPLSLDARLTLAANQVPTGIGFFVV